MKINLCVSVAMAFLAIVMSSTYSQEILTGKSASDLFSNAQIVRTGVHSTVPSFVEFAKGQELDLDEFKSWTSKNFRLESGMSFELINIENDNLGHKHYRYQQTYNGKAVEHTRWMVHTTNDRIYSMNGLIYPSLSASSFQTLSEDFALSQATDYVNAEVYKWQIPEEESHVKIESGDPDATYYPSGKLVYVSKGGSLEPNSFHLAYKFNIYAHTPISRSEIFVDAMTGIILFENEVFHNIDVTGTAQTVYNGSQTITADYSGGSYRLREVGRGNGVNTFDMNNGTTHGNAVDFTDSDNLWNNVNANLDEYATDAHWGAEMTYDYYWLEHGRNSIDGNGFALNSYVHYGTSYSNAFWDGQRMTYGDGNASPLTSIDIAGHEVSHGLTTFTANLIYQAESGALNESFSDIFGTSVEHFGRPNNWDWLIGGDFNTIRSMSNPNSFGDPNTYFGNYWASLTGGDSGGVHSNSGVQNYWYYLLVSGGSGTNDNGDAYSLNGIGFNDAAAIAFRNLTVYLSPGSDYLDARFYAIQAAIDLFGSCSPQVEACTNAWYAVGIGAQYAPGTVADMSAPITGGCSVPFTVDFTNSSINGSTFEWDFGDGNTSTSVNPSHTYTALGDYTIQLIAGGGLCGPDTTIWINYISVDTMLPCEAVMPQNGVAEVQTSCSGILYDSGGSFDDYGPGEDAQVTIAPFGAAQVDLTFSFLDVEPGLSGGCDHDYISVFDGPTSSSPLIGTYCNNNAPSTVSSTGSTITIFFHSDGGIENAGYIVNWDCVLPTGPPTANFVSNTNTTSCGKIEFTDVSLNGPNQWLWNFGDGNTATTQNPTHNYTSNGTYSVSLTATNAFGSDILTYSSMITVLLATAPSVTGDNICENTTAFLGAAGSGGDLDWYESQTGAVLVNSGGTFITPSLNTTTSYWVEEDIPGLVQNLGPANNSFGGGGFFNGNQHLLFDVNSPCQLKTVKVYANGAGNRYVELRNNLGMVVQSTTIFIPDGEQVITLNFDLSVGNDWQLGTQPNSNQALFRNNSGPTFPYTVGGGEVTITQSSPGTDYYYYYYDWVIESPGCKSERAEVVANVNANADATIDPAGPFCTYEAAQQLTATDPGGTWSADCGNCIGGVTGIFDPSVAGDGMWVISYTIGGNCPDQQTTTVTVNDCLGIGEIGNGISVFPNPSGGEFVILFEKSLKAKIVITDIAGRIIFQNSYSDKRIDIDLAEKLVNGTYFLTTLTPDNQLVFIDKIQIIR